MVDYTRRGSRIRVDGYRRTLSHTFHGEERGVVVSESDTGLGDCRRLVSIQWDSGEDWGPLYAEEIVEDTS